MWTSILAQSVKELCLSCLGECFVWPSLQFIGLYSVLFFSFLFILKTEKKKVSQANISIKFSKLSSHALASFSPSIVLQPMVNIYAYNTSLLG